MIARDLYFTSLFDPETYKGHYSGKVIIHGAEVDRSPFVRAFRDVKCAALPGTTHEATCFQTHSLYFPFLHFLFCMWFSDIHIKILPTVLANFPKDQS